MFFKFSYATKCSEVFATSEVNRYVIDCMASVGTRDVHAAKLSEVLLAADLRGHFSHGLNRLGKQYERSSGWPSIK